MLVKLKQYFPFIIDGNVINYQALSDWFDIRTDTAGRSPRWFTSACDSLGRQGAGGGEGQAPTRLECLGWSAAEPVLCWLWRSSHNSFIKGIHKLLFISCSWPFKPVRVACSLLSEVLVLPCGCRFDAAGWQPRSSLGSSLPQALPQARGRNRLGTGLQPIVKPCQITGKAPWGTQAFCHYATERPVAHSPQKSIHHGHTGTSNKLL